MSSAPEQSEETYRIRGTSAASIVRSVERGVTTGALRPGDVMPSTRQLANDLDLSPSTVAAAYRDLRQRGVIVTHDRSRTVVGHRPPLASRLAPDIPEGVTDLASGNPDPTLLPDLGPALARVGPVHRLYGDPQGVEVLLALARDAYLADHIPADHLAVVAGGLDGIERVLEVHLRVGDAIAVEDPGYVGLLDLTRALGLRPVPVPVDGQGMIPDGLATALERGVAAVLLVPRAHNPTGAALTPDRAQQLRAVLDGHPDVLVVEDDHAALIAGVEAQSLVGDRERWAVVRSLAKGLGPDLRVAVLTGDDDTVARVLGRQRLGTGWVSHLLQHLAAEVWTAAIRDGTLHRAVATYRRRRAAVADALASLGLQAMAGTGLNVWLHLAEEVPVVQGLMGRGWAVQAGEPFRIEAPPGLRITVAALDERRAQDFADDLGVVLGQRWETRRG